MVGVNSKGGSWSSVKEKMYEHIRMGNFAPLLGEDMEKMTFSPVACDGTSEFLLLCFSLSTPTLIGCLGFISIKKKEKNNKNDQMEKHKS